MTIRPALPRLAFLLLAIVPLQINAKVPKGTMTAPAQEGPVQVEFSTAAISKWTDLPLGAYRVPNSDVIVSGHQKGGAAPMLLFGLVGVAVQSSVNAGNGKDAMASAEKALTFSIDEESKAKLAELMADPTYAGKFTKSVTGDRKFEVTGAVVLSFANRQDVLPYVTLRVKLMQGGDDKLWTTRYIASKGARRPLVGEGSWTADSGAPLRTQVSILLDSAIRTMLNDIASPYARDEASLLTVKGFFPHVNKPLQVVGYKLGEENGQILFLPKLGTTIVFAGVNLLDPSTMVINPWTKKDKPLKVLKPNDPALAGIISPTANSSAPASASAEDVDADELPATPDADDEPAEEAESSN